MSAPDQTPTVAGRDRWIAFFLLLGTVAALGLAQRNMGVMRDEAYYFQAAERYWGWFDRVLDGKLEEARSEQGIRRFWSYNNEHPPLFKVMSAFSWRAMHGYQGEKGGRYYYETYPKKHKSLMLLDEISAFRMPGWLLTGLAVALIYLFGCRIESRLAGLVAALLFVTVPRVFFHGQLCAFDVAVATMWLLIVYAYFCALTRARWALVAGVVFGLGMATKHNVWFLPPLLVIHYLMVIWPDVSLRPLRLPRVPALFLCMAILGPVIFVASWPWLWFDTVAHIKGYIGFHTHHAFYNMEYLGQNWGKPPLPISYPFVMTLFTVPTVLVLLALAGLGVYLRGPVLELLSRLLPDQVRSPAPDFRFRFRARRSWLRPAGGLDPKIGWLLGINALFPLVLIALPNTPIFGGTKHWLTAYPFLALLAGVAISRLWRGLGAARRARAAADGELELDEGATAGGAIARSGGPAVGLAGVALALVLALPGALNTYFCHPFGLSQYNALAGGPAGGADLGLNRQFWGYAVRQLLPWMNETLPKRANIYFHDTNHDSYAAYIRNGLLREDLLYAGMEKPAIEGSDHAMVHHELHFNKYDYWIWAAYKTAAPVRVLHLDGVPVLSFYSRPKPGAATAR